MALIGFQHYLYVGREETQAMAPVLIEAPDNGNWLDGNRAFFERMQCVRGNECFNGPFTWCQGSVVATIGIRFRLGLSELSLRGNPDRNSPRRSGIGPIPGLVPTADHFGIPLRLGDANHRTLR